MNFLPWVTNTEFAAVIADHKESYQQGIKTQLRRRSKLKVGNENFREKPEKA